MTNEIIDNKPPKDKIHFFSCFDPGDNKNKTKTINAKIKAVP